jgi:hypothetical protein
MSISRAQFSREQYCIDVGSILGVFGGFVKGEEKWLPRRLKSGAADEEMLSRLL